MMDQHVPVKLEGRDKTPHWCGDLPQSFAARAPVPPTSPAFGMAMVPKPAGADWSMDS